jgi:hypothetical protein
LGGGSGLGVKDSRSSDLLTAGEQLRRALVLVLVLGRLVVFGFGLGLGVAAEHLAEKAATVVRFLFLGGVVTVFLGFLLGATVLLLSLAGSGLTNCTFVIPFRIAFVSLSLSLTCVVLGMDCGLTSWDVSVVAGWPTTSATLRFVTELRLLLVTIGSGLLMP